MFSLFCMSCGLSVRFCWFVCLVCLFGIPVQCQWQLCLSDCLSQTRSQGFVPGLGTPQARENALGTRLCLSVLPVSSVCPICLICQFVFVCLRLNTTHVTPRLPLPCFWLVVTCAWEFTLSVPSFLETAVGIYRKGTFLGKLTILFFFFLFSDFSTARLEHSLCLKPLLNPWISLKSTIMEKKCTVPS